MDFVLGYTIELIFKVKEDFTPYVIVRKRVKIGCSLEDEFTSIENAVKFLAEIFVKKRMK